jgi:hypothetical protein
MSSEPNNGWANVQRLQGTALLIGVVGLLLCAAGAVFDPVHYYQSNEFANPRQFFHSYLIAFNFCLALTLGSLAIWMLHNLTGGWWGLVIRRWLEAATRTLPLMALFFVPIACGLAYLYIWVDPSDQSLSPFMFTILPGQEIDELLEHKEAWLNVPFFLVRAAVYFACWLILAFALNRWSAAEDERPDPELARRAQMLSGPGLIIYGLTMTLAAVDWTMSLEPMWYSTIFGAIVATGQMLPALGLAILGTTLLASRRPLADVVTPQIWNDLGNLLLAFVMLWTYMSFSQLLLIWSENLKEEIPWYVIRAEGGWQLVGILLAVFYFTLPFVLLLSRDIKRHPRRLAVVAGLLVVVSFVHQYWLVAPVTSPKQLSVHWMDLAALAGVGGIWLSVFLWQLRARPLVPVHDPLLAEALHHA